MRRKVLPAIRRATLLLVAMFSITLLCVSPAKAGTTITQSTCPVVIAMPGEYSLATDVGPCAPFVDGIDITASNVTLHLNGHTISGSPGTFGACDFSSGIHVFGTPVVPVALARILGTGTITGFFHGVQAEDSAGSFVKFVTITTNCGAAISAGVFLDSSTSMWKLEGNVVSGDNVSVSMWLFGNDNDIVRNDVNNTIVIAANNTVVNNTAHDANDGFFGGGIETQYGGGPNNNNEIHANTTERNGYHGIQLKTGSLNNHVSGNTSLNNGIWDLEEDNANCDNNKWDGDRFNTTNNPSCVH